MALFVSGIGGSKDSREDMSLSLERSNMSPLVVGVVISDSDLQG